MAHTHLQVLPARPVWKAPTAWAAYPRCAQLGRSATRVSAFVDAAHPCLSIAHTCAPSTPTVHTTQRRQQCFCTHTICVHSHLRRFLECAGSVGCTNVPSSYYNMFAGGSSVYWNGYCRPGYYCSVSGGGTDVPRPCESGKYSGHYASDCTPTNAGYYSSKDGVR